MLKIWPELEQKGVQVLVISFTPSAKVAAYVAKYPLPFPVVSDAEMKAYRAFSLGRARIWSFFSPRALWRFLKLIFRGWLPKTSGDGQDLLQLGGDFILDSEQRLVYAHPSKNAADRPSHRELLQALPQ